MKTEKFLFEGIRLLQLVFVPLFAFMTILGLFLFLIAFKSPIRKRKAFILSIFSPFGMLFFLYAPLLHAYYLFKKPAEPTGNEELRDVVEQVEPWGEVIYKIFIVISEPIIVFLFYLGIAVLLMAAKNPVRKRLGTGLIVGSPILWVLIQNGESIYRIFVY